MMNGNESEILLYKTEDGITRIDVRLVEGTVWLTQLQIAELFQREKNTISEHVKYIYEEGELTREATVRNFRTVQMEGNREVARNLEYYSLEMIIAVGYRVKSFRGTQFRQWATERLRELIVKGFTLDDERLASGRGADSYFDELIERIRAIRTSEYNLYRKVREIYSTSIDYDSRADITQEFYATVQNKMHWAAHGHTAAEIIRKRADATQANMGMTSYKGKGIRSTDVTTAKNYLKEEEIKKLELLVDQYLTYAELQAMNKQPMYMQDWSKKLDAFLVFNSQEVLTGAGQISKALADAYALDELKKYKKMQVDAINTQDIQTLETQLKALPKRKAKRSSI